MDKLEEIEIIIDAVERKVRSGFSTENEILNSMRYYSTMVLETKDPFMIYTFAERLNLNFYGKEERTKAIRFDDLQKAVIASNNEEYMYLFGDRVLGADLKQITHAMPKGNLRKKLEREMRPIEEYNM